MEEFVGGLWHRFITGAAQREHPKAAVSLAEIERTAGILFRALGGDPGLRVASSAEQTHGARRRWLARIAHIEDRVSAASRDAETLRLPASLALFPERALNRDLYLWLIAQAAASPADPTLDWLVCNQQATLATLVRFPGLAPRYRRLVSAALALRIPPEKLPRGEAAAESAIRQALQEPGSVASLPAARRPPQPVPLWLVPAPPSLDRRQQPPQADTSESNPECESQAGDKQRRQGQREDTPDDRNAFILPFRAESLLSFGEYVKVDRKLDDDPNSDAARVAADMDVLSVTRDGQNAASKVRFDLDLPSDAVDDIPIQGGIVLPEWNWKTRQLVKDQCRLTILEPRDAQPCAVPPHLNRQVRRVRQQFEALTPSRRWIRNQPDGSELDMEACVRAWSDRRAGHKDNDAGHYLRLERQERDLACLLLADFSLSTDAWVGNEHRVIDVIKDSLMLFSEALAATGDNVGIYGFSSLRRGNIRFHRIKDFSEKHGALTRGRIQAIKPGYYTRMGAAIRQSTRILAKQPNALRLLLILSDGKPNDFDHYEGRFAIEDTRMSLVEARRQGLQPFCVTIDQEGAGYLPHLFGPAGYTVIRKPSELPSRLPILYAQLTSA